MNCKLVKSPGPSHNTGLLEIVLAIGVGITIALAVAMPSASPIPQTKTVVTGNNAVAATLIAPQAVPKINAVTCKATNNTPCDGVHAQDNK